MNKLPCPECGSPLDIIENGQIEETVVPGYHVRGKRLPRQCRPAPFAACQGCDWCQEIRS